MRTNLSSTGRGDKDIDFTRGKKRALWKILLHMHQQYRLKQGMKNQQGLKSHRHQGKLI
jgi:hypothetical protein